MKKWMIAALLVGAGLGGAVLAQAFSSSSMFAVSNTKTDDLYTLAEGYAIMYNASVSSSKSPAQTQQVAAEFSVRLQLIQIKQNAEIIRLLKKQAGEK